QTGQKVPLPNVNPLYSPRSIVLFARSALNVPALTRKFLENSKPPSVGFAAAAQSCASSFTLRFVDPDPEPLSFRASYHANATFPLDWSTAMRGKNWLNFVRSVFTFNGALHEPPSSSENRMRTSKLSEDVLGAIV